MPGSLFIVNLTYSSSLDELDESMKDHIWFLDHDDSGDFITSGKKVPRTGGIIIAVTEFNQKWKIG